MSNNIRFLLYESNGITLRYTFPLVQETNLPVTTKKFTEIDGYRGNGSIVVTGSKKAADITIKGLFDAENYDDIISDIDELETALSFGEPYVLKVDKNVAHSTQYSYNIKRLSPIIYSPNLRNGDGFQDYTITLRKGTW